MTERSVYVGEIGAEGALDWGGDPRSGNIPRRIGPFFPGYGAREHPHELLIDWIDRGILSGIKTDWGASAARVTVNDLRYFIEFCYGRRVPDELSAFLITLNPETTYALVGCEF
jgi:hypothetical protein